MGPSDLVLAPWRAARLAVRALDDLNAIAERARRSPDPVDEVRERLDAIILIGEAIVATGQEVIDGGADLTRTAKDLNALTLELISGGRDLTETAKELDEVAERLEADLRTVRAVLPRVLEGLDTVEALEGAVETVADTVEPLQGAAERVGRVTKRLSRS